MNSAEAFCILDQVKNDISYTETSGVLQEREAESNSLIWIFHPP